MEGAHAEALVRDPWLIASRYLKGWFGVDAIASPPFALLALLQSGEESDTSSFAMFRALRALRIFKLVKVINNVRMPQVSEY